MRKKNLYSVLVCILYSPTKAELEWDKLILCVTLESMEVTGK